MVAMNKRKSNKQSYFCLLGLKIFFPFLLDLKMQSFTCSKQKYLEYKVPAQMQENASK